MDMKVMFDKIEQLAAKTNKVEQGDYIGEDGLLYCHKCNTPKQCRVKHHGVLIAILGETTVQMCNCKCAAEAAEKMRLADERFNLELDYRRFKTYEATDDYDLFLWLNAHNYKISQKLVEERKSILKKICFREDEMQSWTFENDDHTNARLSKAMQNYADRFKELSATGQGIILFGDVGTGKSYYAACIANALTDKGIPVFMTNFDWIRNKVQESFQGRQDFFDRLNSYPLLIIDDIGAEAETEFMQELVFSVIDGRVRSGKPIIVTTNLTSNELKNPASTKKRRVYSRLLGACLPVEVAGDDRRRKKLAAGAQEMKDLLGL